MSNALSAIGLSGLNAAQRQLDVAAHNVANAQTPGFQRQRVQQTARPDAGGVDTRTGPEPGVAGDGGDLGHLTEDLVNGHMALYSFAANLKTVSTAQDMLGTLLDDRA